MFVRQALMILPTLPRVIGPGRAVLAAGVGVHERCVDQGREARSADRCALQRRWATPSTTLTFTRPEEKLGFLTLQSGSQLGKGKIRVIATSGKYRAESEVWLEVRTPNVPSSRFQRATLAPGESWKARPQGASDSTARRWRTLEVSALPPINLDGRLEYLIHYPHGCLEQTTSSVFPQLYLPALIKLDQNRRLRGREQHPRRPRAPAQPAAPERRLRLLAGRVEHGPATRLAQRLGHDLRRALLARSREGGLRAARRHEGRVAALPEGRARSAGTRTPATNGRTRQRRASHRGRALRAGVSPVHAGAGRRSRRSAR